jgi:gamma-glutamylcyclotransferase (GGCT)/AIG2-like uncharacterized protein YtfP
MRHWRPFIPSTPPEPQHLQAVFVYGTLRPRDGRTGWAGDAEVAPASRGTTAGRLYYGPGYPYFVKDVHETGRVVGDVLLFDTRHAAYQDMRRVELGAGYVECEVTVTLESGAMVQALAWDATERSREEYCTAARRIHDGDFLGPDRQAVEQAIYEAEDDDTWWDEDEPVEDPLGIRDTLAEARGER